MPPESAHTPENEIFRQILLDNPEPFATIFSWGWVDTPYPDRWLHFFAAVLVGGDGPIEVRKLNGNRKVYTQTKPYVVHDPEEIRVPTRAKNRASSCFHRNFFSN